MELKRQKQVQIEQQRRSLILDSQESPNLNFEQTYTEQKIKATLGMFQNPWKLKCVYKSSLESLSKKNGFDEKYLEFKDNQFQKNKIDLHDQTVTGLHILSNEFFGEDKD